MSFTHKQPDSDVENSLLGKSGFNINQKVQKTSMVIWRMIFAYFLIFTKDQFILHFSHIFSNIQFWFCRISHFLKTKYRLHKPFITPMSEQEEPNNSCSMVGFLGIMIQLGLGALSFSVLILKRYFEHPKRPWNIWAFDASKQMISQLIAHFINLTISLALTYDKKNSDECLWYFVTNVFDNSMGVFICIVLLKLIENNLRSRRKFELISGNYYRKIDPLSVGHELRNQKTKQQPKDTNEIKNIQMNQNFKANQKIDHKESLIAEADSRMQTLNVENSLRKKSTEVGNEGQSQPDQSNFIFIIDYKAWIIQLGIWNGIVILAKCVLFGLQFGLEKQLQQFSIYILGWIEEYPILELFLVIVFVPVILNAVAYWIQDNFLMKRQKQAEQKNLIEQNMKQNAHMQDELGNQLQKLDKNKVSGLISQRKPPKKEKIVEDNDNRFQFHDDYDPKEQENPVERFQNFDKFGKFAL